VLHLAVGDFKKNRPKYPMLDIPFYVIIFFLLLFFEKKIKFYNF
jgi:hypothetical protein